jgi:hypothetical protein
MQRQRRDGDDANHDDEAPQNTTPDFIHGLSAPLAFINFVLAAISPRFETKFQREMKKRSANEAARLKVKRGAGFRLFSFSIRNRRFKRRSSLFNKWLWTPSPLLAVWTWDAWRQRDGHKEKGLHSTLASGAIRFRRNIAYCRAFRRR